MTAHVAPQTAPTVAAPEPKAVRAEEEATVDDSARSWPGADFSQVPVRTGRERRDPDEEGQVSEVLDSPGTPLDTEARSLLEPRFGRDFSRVRVHTGAKAAESATALAARAYTVGQDIVFGAGRYAPNTTAGMRLLAHELTHTLQQPVAAPGVARSGLRLGDTADPAEHEAELVADQVLRNAPLDWPISVTGHRIRRQPTTAADPDTHADVLPPPRTVVWSTDRFTVSFARTGRPGNTQLEMTIRYTGPRTVVSSPVAKATVSIGEKPLAVRLLDNGPTSLALDLYGDGKKIVEVRDEAHLSQLPGGPGRSHSFDAVVDQQTVFATSLTVLDPQAKQADLVPAPRPEHAGENPRVEGVRFGRGGWRILLDGDGDQDKELQVTLSTPTDGTLSVEAVQRSTRATRTVTLPVPTGSGPLSPIVEEVTDGHAPNRIRLFAAPSGPALLLGPGTHVPAASTYPAAIGNDTANLLFPPEPKPRRKIAAAGETRTAAGITATDVALGAYRDVFRLSVRQNPDGKTATLGLSALNDGTVRDTAGTPLSLSGPLRFSVLTTGTTGLDLDLDGDGKADLRIFDRLSTPTDADGGGPPARARNHQIRVAGPAVGGERTFDFRYRYGTLQDANATAGPVSTEAARNAEAVGKLAGHGPAGHAADMLDQVEIEMLGLRRRSVDLGLVARAVFDKNLALWQALVELRAQLAQGVSAPARARAVAAVAGYAGAVRANETQPTTEQYVLLAELAKAAESGNWPALFGAYSNAMATFDAVLRERLEKRGGQDAKAAGQLASCAGN
ncbi:DUF4157 domain-containing protein [Amycolatopsis halotolerans]|uniref:DUF4157 domain-containing protein n=1 Tax=Amycolatopsis halotolerans TaxID=330083 RepID=A0ABV7QKB4_9PSEU